MGANSRKNNLYCIIDPRYKNKFCDGFLIKPNYFFRRFSGHNLR